MSQLVFGFGLFIAALSIYGLLQPQKLISAVLHTVKQPWGFAFAIGVRLGLAALFLAAADQANWPVFVRILGWLMLAAAASIAIMGHQRMIRFAEYWAGLGSPVTRAWLLLGVVFGLAVAWAA